MAKTRRAYTGGAVSTTTSSDIAASGTTSFTITANTGWPYGSAPFYVVVSPGTASEEKILVTRSGSGDSTLNVASDARRGLDGTSAVAHATGAVVFPVFTAVDADEANELASKWTTKGDLVSYGSSTFEKLGVGSNGALLMADSGETSGLKWAQPGYTYVQTVYFTSNGTFTKATYPWLRAIRVHIVGGGGGGGGIADTSGANRGYAGGGSGAAYVAKWFDVSAIGASETVTIGAGGAGGAAGGANDGANGTASSFGALLSADYGNGGDGIETTVTNFEQPTAGGTATGGDIGFNKNGGFGMPGAWGDAQEYFGIGFGGDSQFGQGGRGGTGYNPNDNGEPGQGYGSGGGGGYAGRSFSGGAAGGNGANGLVLIELYA